jgi:uncharacterized protein YceK
MKSAIGITSCITTALALSGCASIISEKTQPVSVQTIMDNKEVAGIGCVLQNDEGKWFITSPGSTVINKSTADMTVDCKNDKTIGHDVVVSKSNGSVWGNILLGGGVGYIVDRNTGAGFDYPTVITVELKKIEEVVGLAPVVEVAKK